MAYQNAVHEEAFGPFLVLEISIYTTIIYRAIYLISPALDRANGDQGGCDRGQAGRSQEVGIHGMGRTELFLHSHSHWRGLKFREDAEEAMQQTTKPGLKTCIHRILQPLLKHGPESFYTYISIIYQLRNQLASYTNEDGVFL